MLSSSVCMVKATAKGVLMRVRWVNAKLVGLALDRALVCSVCSNSLHFNNSSPFQSVAISQFAQAFFYIWNMGLFSGFHCFPFATASKNIEFE